MDPNKNNTNNEIKVDNQVKEYTYQESVLAKNNTSNNYYNPTQNSASTQLQTNQRVNNSMYNEQESFRDESYKMKYKHQNRSVFERIGCGCKSIACSGCLIIILIVIGLIYLITTKPIDIWSKTVSFLNDGLTIQNKSTENIDQVKSSINQLIQGAGEQDIYISEDQLTVLAQDKFKQLKNLRILIDNDKLNMYWDLDSKIPENSLKGVIQISLDENNKFYIIKIGTQRIGLPKFIRNFITNSAYSFLNLGTNKDDKYGFIANIISTSNLEIQHISFSQGKIYLKVNLKINIFK